MTYAELCDLLIEHSEREATNQTAFFRDCLLEGRQRENTTATPALGLARVTVDTPIYFSLDDILAKVRAKNVERVGTRQGPMFGDFDRFLMRIESKLNDARYDFLLKPTSRNTSASLSDLLRDFVGLGTKKAAVTKEFRPVPLPGTADITIRNELREVDSRNVIARITGSRHPDEFIIYSAHWDHLGKDPSMQGDQIFNGALDNASGVATMLEVAEAFAKLPEKPERSILFLAVTAEEKGLLGAKYYATNPLYPANRTLAKVFPPPVGTVN